MVEGLRVRGSELRLEYHQKVNSLVRLRNNYKSAAEGTPRVFIREVIHNGIQLAVVPANVRDVEFVPHLEQKEYDTTSRV